MALEITFRELFTQLNDLKATLDPLRCLLPEDPHNVEVVFVQHLRESVESVNGWLDHCLEHLQTAQNALGHANLNRPRRALTLCQTSFDEAERTFAAELLSFDKLREITRLGARHRDTSRLRDIWRTWSHNMMKDLDVCRYELGLTRKALTACWQELAEHAAQTSISVRTTNIGQKIKAPNLGTRRDIGERVT